MNCPNKKEERTVDEILAELDSMIGMANIKKAIREMANRILIRKEYEKTHGTKSAGGDYNIVIIGNSGTGKTTIVHILGALFKAVGILKTDNVIEVKGNDLICQYIGQSKDKVNEICDAAMGGVLFVDEITNVPPFLDGYNTETYVKEAWETLLTRIYYDYEKFIVIISDYKEKMDEFLNNVVGYKTKFSHFFCLDDYSEKQGGAA